MTAAVATSPPNLRHEPRMAKAEQDMPRPAKLPDPDQVYNALIGSLVARRVQLDIKQLQLARRMGVDNDYVAKLECGIRRASGQILALWAAALDGGLTFAARSAPPNFAGVASRAPWRSPESDPPMSGGELKNLRANLGLTQAQFAVRVLRCKWDGTVRKYEKSEIVPPIAARRVRSAMRKLEARTAQSGKGET